MEYKFTTCKPLPIKRLSMFIRGYIVCDDNITYTDIERALPKDLRLILLIVKAKIIRR